MRPSNTSVEAKVRLGRRQMTGGVTLVQSRATEAVTHALGRMFALASAGALFHVKRVVYGVGSRDPTVGRAGLLDELLSCVSRETCAVLHVADDR